MPILVVLSAALSLGAAWLIPNTLLCALLGWGSALLIAMGIQQQTKARHWFLFGVLCHAIGFYWLFGTIRDFSGLPAIAAAGVWGLFVTVSALQFVLFYWLSRWGAHTPLATTAAWIIGESVPVRIFPWQLGHTQAALPHLTQIVDLSGTLTLSALMIFVATTFVQAVRSGSRRSWAPALLLLGATLTYGSMQLSKFSIPSGSEIATATVQANLTTLERSNIRYFARNTERYVALSKGITAADTLTIWPEAVLLDPIPFSPARPGDLSALIQATGGKPMVLGSLTRNGVDQFFNSALAVQADGSFAVPYHKRILMPFGEYTPFADLFPFLREMNASVSDFTAGTTYHVFELAVGEISAKIAPLICYEEVLPSLVAESVRGGAELLIGLSNDAWFGKTAAPDQHHMIASFRAIEHRRYFIRATNSGLTAVIDPTGRTVATLPVFGEGVLEATVRLVQEQSVYSKYFSEWYWMLFAAVALAARRRQRR